MNRVLCSTGALIGRPNGRDFTLLDEYKKRLNCDGYEFMMYDSWYEKVDEIKNFLTRFDAPVYVFHAEKSIGDLISRNDNGDVEKAIELFRVNCFLAKVCGAEKMVLHLWGGMHSDKDIENNIKVYGYLREIAGQNDIMLTVENVVCIKKDPMSYMFLLKETYPDVKFTFDTKMAEFHGQTELIYENQELFADNVSHIHVNDYSGVYKDWKNLKTLHIGDGQVDFVKFFPFVKSMNYGGDFTVEATSFDQNGVINFDALNRSFELIRQFLK